MANILSRIPFLTACIPMTAAWCIISILAPQGVQNDDFQLYFMFCNGGSGAVPFSFHSGALEGFVLAGLNSLSDQVNWYLIMLQLVTGLACMALNYFAVLQWKANRSDSQLLDFCRLGAALCFLVYLNFRCIYFAQYTHTAVLCACASVFLLYSWWQQQRGIGQLVVSILLFICSYELRDQSVAAFFIMGTGVLAVSMLQHTPKANHRKWWGLALFPVLLSALWAADLIVQKSHPEWEEAKRFCNARVSIQDATDNSGINKDHLLEQEGVDMTAWYTFRSFTYTPGFCHEDSEQLEKLAQIHQSHRKGLFGSDLLAKYGILSPAGYKFHTASSMLRTITPYTPLVIMLIIVLPYVNRRTIVHALPILLVVLLYLGLLTCMHRVVDRVFNPVLYAGAIWLMGCPISNRKWPFPRLLCTGTVILAAVATLFCLRHVRYFTTHEPPAWKHCTANPQNLYLTTSIQDIGIIPAGIFGTSLRYFATTNIIPIADGWCFYSPAYRATLQSRNIDNPYAEICKKSTYVVTRNRDESWALRNISNAHKIQFGSGLRFHRTGTVGQLSFWQAEPSTD